MILRNRQVPSTEYAIAARSAPRSEPAKRYALRPMAGRLWSLSTTPLRELISLHCRPLALQLLDLFPQTHFAARQN